ncbi:MAG TPA: discoidin domain-containing protein [Chthonomonas sp.]|uniref:discoidin domain-containing protein n=1 Tax=Chthonomonas sp. TaxID=2282153 RepID=UPI002B4B4F1D|nr:discoidin domain-containing protein [Chthonomonas sp.]HLI49837.1 discoidin domain-containing protein [Chthonomonas sp.]
MAKLPPLQPVPIENPITYPDPITLNGTKITGLTAALNAWSAKVHRQSRFGMTTAELWFYRDGNWFISPAPVVMTPHNHPVLRRRLREPATLEATLLDQQGFLAPTNVTSPYNQGTNGFEPLLTEARQILFRVGTWCYNDLALNKTPTANVTPSSGQLSYLTDGTFTPWNATSNPNQYAVTFSLNANQVLTITFDLGSVQTVHHVAARFGTGGLTGCTLPASLTVAFSNDNVNWASVLPRPIGGPNGDWDDAYLNDATDPNVTEVFICDVEQNARYVQLQITAYQNQTIGMDEVGIFGGTAGQWLGMNRFCGYLGDNMAYDAEGHFSFSATDVLKRLADNNETRLTAPFGNADVADIAYALLTGTGYWPGASGAYDGVWSSSQIGWQSGVGLTGLVMPIWQGQGNNHLGYQYELWHEVGWLFEADGNGVLQVREPPYRQMRPDRVLISAPDGNEDVRHVVRTGTGKELRNAVSITTGQANAGQLGVTVQLYDPASVAAFGHRRLIITDPLLTTPDLQTKMGAAILRDYAWRLWRLECEISPDYDTRIRGIHAFRTALRPALSPKTQAGVRQQELWSLEAIEEHFTSGAWWGLAEYAPYVPSALPPPTITQLASSSTSPYTMTISWQSYTGQTGVLGFRVYYSTVGPTGPFTLVNGSSPAPASATSYTFGSFSSGQQVWAYVTTLDINGHESIPSVVYSALAGGAPSTQSGWVVTDLATAGRTSVSTTQGGVSGVTYEFAFLFSSPPAGLRGFFFTYAVGSIPSNQNDFHSWVHAVGSDVGHINVPAGQRGSGQNEFAPPWVAGQLTWYQRLFVPGGIASGTKIYWRLWSWYNGQWLGSNIVYWQF